MSLSQSSNKRTRDLPIGVLVPSKQDDTSQNGNLFLFRDVNQWRQHSEELGSAPSQTQDQNYADNTVVCSVGIPLSVSIVDFLSFVGSFDQFISHYRLIREANPQSYMVLIKFRQSMAARDYYSSFNGRPFSSMEPETCSIYFVKSIHAESMLAPPFTFFHLDDESQSSVPTCPVCLEKMDDKLTSLLTIPCQHTFHGYCLSKWGDGSCPICRYSSKPSSKEISNSLNPMESDDGRRDDRNHCLECLSTEGLWICLICGYIGCSNGTPSHAYDHYSKTSHPYALEIETQRVWDYAGKGFVHRLIQNVVDGKLVELPDTEGDATSSENVPSQEKLEAMSLEYTYLLSSQLDSQRMYYEDQLEEAMAQLSSLTQQVRVLSRDLESLDLRNQELKRLKSNAETLKANMQSSRERLEKETTSARTQLEESRQALVKAKQTNDELLSDIAELKQSQQQKQQMIKELGDQVRDLNFFLEARETVQSHPELEGGSVGTTSQQQYQQHQQHRQNTRKHRKKR